jgi:hypothetical protein
MGRFYGAGFSEKNYPTLTLVKETNNGIGALRSAFLHKALNDPYLKPFAEFDYNIYYCQKHIKHRFIKIIVYSVI